MFDLTGVMPAMFTCYDSQGDVTTEGLDEYLTFCIDRGCSGFFVGGSSGEGLLQNTEDRAEYLEAVVKMLAGEVPVIAHVGAPSTRETCELARHAADVGADVVGSVLPIYYSFDADAIADYYRAIAENCDLPMLVYYLASASSQALDPLIFVEKLASIPHVQAMKYTSSDLEPFKQIIELVGDELSMIMGSDQMFLPALTLGADGAIGTTHNFMPEMFVGIYESYNSGDMKRAEELMDRTFKIIHRLHRKYRMMAACREIMKIRGFDIGPSRRPLPPLREGKKDELRADLEDLDFFSDPIR
ncbi:MAG: dihydrodipicolinate synthase family protein [Planctomycetota bacterium]